MKRLFTFILMICAACVAGAANYLTFTAEEDSSTFGIVNKNNNPDLQYSLDGGETWTALAVGDTVTLVHKGDKALLKGNNPDGFSKGGKRYSYFVMIGKIAASGSVMSLIDGVGLSTEIPEAYCFNNLFSGCTSLTQAPELPASTLADYCYWYMFSGCTSLTQAPELPATTLANGCYEWMFSGCTSLTQAPELPATTLANSCYDGMFKGCTSLTQAPELPATTLAGGCYREMFANCTSLSQISVSFDDWGDGYTNDWSKNVAPAGTFICPKALAEEYGANRIPHGWRLKNIIDGDTVDVTPNTNYLTFTAEEDSSTFGIVNKNNNPDLHYSLDGGETWTALTGGDKVTLVHKGDKALLTGYNPNGFSKGLWNKHSSFSMTGKIAASGSVMSLIDGLGLSTEIPKAYCLYNLFSGCTSLTQVPELPATTLADGCYERMFSGCTSLTQAPELPATTLTNYCYYDMFAGCTSLTQAPELPATTLAYECYSSMFSGCTSLTQAPELPATTLADYCYEYMFSGCTSLTQAPELPATTLADYCYYGMFSSCKKIAEIKVFFHEWLNGPETDRWLADVAPTGTFICPKDLTSIDERERIPYGWMVKYIEDDSITTDKFNYLIFKAEEDNSTFGIKNKNSNPEVQYSLDGGETWVKLSEDDNVTLTSKGDSALLKGTNPKSFSSSDGYSSFTMTGKIAASGSVMSLIDGIGVSTKVPCKYCFSHLFSGCTSLTQAPELPASRLTVGCYADMFSDCTSLTQAPELPATTLPVNCYARMFSGCKSMSKISVLFSLWNALSTEEWVKDVAPTGTFICPSDLDIAYGKSKIPFGWMTNNISDEKTDTVDVPFKTNYLTFTAKEDSSSFGIISKEWEKLDVEYSLDDGMTWKLLSEGDEIILALNGDKAMLRGVNLLGFASSSFKMTGKIAASGSIMSLIDGAGISTKIPCDYCFRNLFSGCKSLTQAPELPATTLAYGCYNSMFEGCTSLTQAPMLPAVSLVEDCYSGMFSGCINLSKISILFEYWGRTVQTLDWVKDVSPMGTFFCPKDFPLAFGNSGIPWGWNVKYIVDGDTVDVSYNSNFLTFTAEEDNSTFGIMNYNNNPDLHYSLDDGNTWKVLAEGDTVILAFKGDKAILRGNNPTGFSNENNKYSRFTMKGKIAASGSVMSLIDGIGASKDIPMGNCFRGLFMGCTSLTQAPELPATFLFWMCYESMFSGCTNLTQAPDLPAKALDFGCYWGMFSDCTGLTQAPKLPATTLADYCYSGMFSNCTSLTQAPELQATTLAESCYEYMFHGCTSLSEISVSFDDWDDGYYTVEWVADVAPTGTFICPKTLALAYGNDMVPWNWTVKYIDDEPTAEPNYLTFTAEEDSSTITATDVDADEEDGSTRSLSKKDTDLQYSSDGGKTWNTLENGVALVMQKAGDSILFKGYNPNGFSTKTNRVKFEMTGKVAASGSVMSLIDECGNTTVIPDEYCFANLFEGCAGLTQAPELTAIGMKPYCYQDMFSGCTGLRSAPAIPAEKLEEGSCNRMFYGCENLSEVKVSFTEWTGGTEDWLYGVSPSGTFICPEQLEENVSASNIPNGWLRSGNAELTGMESEPADEYGVWTEGLTIIVSGATGRVEVYDASGAKLKSESSAGDACTFTMPAHGVYLVRTSKRTVKVVL